MFDRYDIMTLIASALLSTFAFVAANNETQPKVEFITFEEPLVITVNNLNNNENNN